MAINFPGPYGLRIFYTSSGRVHKHEMNIDVAGSPAPGTAFGAITVDVNGGTAPNLATYTDQWVSLIRPVWSAASTTIDRAELWRYTPLSFDAVFISAHDISLAGSSGSAISPASQAIWTFRTAEGGIMKIDFIDGTFTPGSPFSYAGLAAAFQDLVDFVLSDDNAFLGRDTSFPIAFLRLLPGTNERLWKELNGR